MLKFTSTKIQILLRPFERVCNLFINVNEIKRPHSLKKFIEGTKKIQD